MANLLDKVGRHEKHYHLGKAIHGNNKSEENRGPANVLKKPKQERKLKAVRKAKKQQREDERSVLEVAKDLQSFPELVLRVHSFVFRWH